MSDQEQRLSYILDALHAGAWEWDIASNISTVDSSWVQMLGYTQAELGPISTQTIIDLTHPDDLVVAAEQYQAVLAGTTLRYHCEVRVRHKQGHWLWVLDTGRASAYDERGVPTKMIGVRQDISERKQIEEALQEEGARFQALTSASNTGAWEWDERCQHLWCSPEYFSMLGRDISDYQSDDCANLQRAWLDLIHPDDRKRAQQVFADYWASDKTGMYDNEFRLRHRDGSWVWVWSRGRYLFDRHGQPTHKALGTHINITERKLHEQSMQQLNSNLEQRVKERTAELLETLDDLRRTQDELLQSEKLASLGALVAGVAHELNTPIGNAMLLATTLKSSQDSFRASMQSGLTRSALIRFLDDTAEGSQIIERNLSRAAELIGSFKQLAVDQASYQRRSFKLYDLVREISLTLQPLLRQTKLQLSNDIADDLLLDNYPGPIGQIIINFINNAIVHAFEGREAGQIHLSVKHTEPGWICFTVRDNGIGISPDNQKKLFDPFFTTKLGLGGSGLGLHISYTLASGLLGGRIEFESELGVGSCFMLHIPLQAAPIKNL